MSLPLSPQCSHSISSKSACILTAQRHGTSPNTQMTHRTSALGSDQCTTTTAKSLGSLAHLPLAIFFPRSPPAQEVAALATPSCMSNHIQESPMILPFPSSQIHSIASSCFLRDVCRVDPFMQSHLCHPVWSVIIPPGTVIGSASFLISLPASPNPGK